VVRVDQLKQILLEGFNGISDTLVFSTNPMIISALYLAEGGSHFQPISFEDLSIGFLNAKQEMSSWSQQQPVLQEDEMPLLKQSKLIRPLILLRSSTNPLLLHPPFLSPLHASLTLPPLPACQLRIESQEIWDDEIFRIFNFNKESHSNSVNGIFQERNVDRDEESQEGDRHGSRE
jgi:hypothetical protein